MAKEVTIRLNDKSLKVPSGIKVKKALELSGYNGKSRPMTPAEAAQRLTAARKKFNVDRMAISGGESTLNRAWLIEYVRALKTLNPDADARIHIDTNGSILTKDYIDELFDAGMTDIGIDLKGCTTETFMRITAIKEIQLAELYLSAAWNAVKYLAKRYEDIIFTGVGIPYNEKLISLDEIGFMGKILYEIDPKKLDNAAYGLIEESFETREAFQ